MDVDLNDIFEPVVDNNGTNGDEDDEHASVEVGPTDPPPPCVTNQSTDEALWAYEVCSSS